MQLATGTFSILFLLIEIVFIAFVEIEIIPKGQDFDYFNKPCATFDKRYGYRYLGDCRTVRVTSGEVEFDNVFKVNRQGFVSSHDFSYRKTDSVAERLLVFGDSFSSGIFLNKTWPDFVQELLNAKGIKTELYNFSIGGGGIMNWHQTFFSEVDTAYEYDGIVLAIFGDNLNRDFFIEHSGDSGIGYSGYFPTVPADELDFRRNFLLKMKKEVAYKSDEWLTGYVKGNTGIRLPGSRFLDFAYSRLQSGIKINSYEAIVRKWESDYFGIAPGSLDWDRMVAKYGRKKVDLLEEMIGHCKRKGKTVILASVPNRSGLKTNIQGNKSVSQREMELISEKFDLPLWDGYEAFRDIEESNLDEYYFKYDGHWKQKGSDRFAIYFSSLYARNPE